MGKYTSSQSPQKSIEAVVPIGPENFSLSLNFADYEAYPTIVGDRCRLYGQLLYYPVVGGVGYPCPSERVDILVASRTQPSAEQWNTFHSMGDVNRDGYIDGTDLDLIGAVIGWTGVPGAIPEDINSDGTVDITDLFICGQNQGLNIWDYFGLYAWVPFATLITDSNGEYSVDWYPADIGYYVFQATATPSPPAPQPAP